MAQTLCSQPIPIASTDAYHRQNNDEQPQSYLSSVKRSRNRGVVLSPQGWQKLMQAGVLYDELGCRYTYEQLSERSNLTERTVSRLLTCEVKVDKSTLKTFFRAFNLSLEASDYTLSNSHGTGAVTSKALTDAKPPTQPVDLDQLVEELSQLRQRMRKYERLFQQLKLNENSVNQQLEHRLFAETMLR
ncbi:hypothetical protein [Leptolyngbya sp. FACHB-16]|uniref:hypothetical protein n=1 Tax=unclassified Leptolyngbya TaxID=2650499 RepID=UPI0016857A62|nr:hypothetical protein [Leptolyngbya sp. FACHB-16]MBD2158787.1 hypothetical protein [Leptolyngbya sp. FACHB-16]